MTHKELITQMLDCIATLRHSSNSFAGDKKAAEAMQAAREYLAAPEQSEPVAWGIVASNTGRICQVELDADEVAEHNPKYVVPLYTHPAPKAEPVNQMLLDALKDAESSLSDYHAGAPWGKYDLDVLEKARAALAAAEQAQGAPEMSTNKIMELADTYACNRHADGHAHMEETPNTSKARAALQAEVERVTKELAASEAINKAAPKAEQPVNQMILEALKLITETGDRAATEIARATIAQAEKE